MDRRSLLGGVGLWSLGALAAKALPAADFRFAGHAKVAPPLVHYTPDNAAFNYTDYAGTLTVDASHARFTRPNIGASAYYTAAPEARVRFQTNARLVRLAFTFTALVTRLDTYNDITEIFVDGAATKSFVSPSAPGTPAAVTVSLPLDGASHLIEVILPFAASLDFNGLYIPPSATISAPAARPATTILCMGDSITHGFWASQSDTSWVYLLGVAKTWQVKNMGYGSQKAVASDGTVVGGQAFDVATYLIGYNDFAAQTSLAAFNAAYTGFINNFRALKPTTKLYCITPIFTTTADGAITMAQYRTEIGNVLTSIGDANNILVNGLSIMTNNANRLNADGIHPNDLGSSEIATNLAGIVVP